MSKRGRLVRHSVWGPRLKIHHDLYGSTKTHHITECDRALPRDWPTGKPPKGRTLCKDCKRTRALVKRLRDADERGLDP